MAVKMDPGYPGEYVDAELTRQALEAALDALTTPALHHISAVATAIALIREALLEFDANGKS
jgi:hypothetical protein